MKKRILRITTSSSRPWYDELTESPYIIRLHRNKYTSIDVKTTQVFINKYKLVNEERFYINNDNGGNFYDYQNSLENQEEK